MYRLSSISRSWPVGSRIRYFQVLVDGKRSKRKTNTISLIVQHLKQIREAQRTTESSKMNPTVEQKMQKAPNSTIQKTIKLT